MSNHQVTFIVNEFGFDLHNRLTPQPGGVRVYAHLWQGIIELQWNDKTLPLHVYAKAESEETSPSLKQRWTAWIACGSAIAIQNSALKAFTRNDLTNYLPDESNSNPSSWTVPITEMYLADLEKAYALDQKGRLSFDIALKRARSLGQYASPAGEKHGAREMLSFLQWSMDAGNPNLYPGESGDDFETARNAMSDITRRKNTRHAGYKSSQDSVEWQLTCLHAPTAWCKQPPILDAALLEGSQQSRSSNGGANSIPSGTG